MKSMLLVEKESWSYGGHDEREQTLTNYLLKWMVSSKPSIITMAATNRPDILDPALDQEYLIDK